MKKLFILGNGVDWCASSLVKAFKKENVFVVNKRIPLKSVILSKICKILYSEKLKYFNFKIIKKIFYGRIFNYIFKNRIQAGDVIYVLIYDHNPLGGDFLFLNYLRKRINHVNISYIFTNIADQSYSKMMGFTEKLNTYYDKVFAFDKIDEKKYGFLYFGLIYDADVNIVKNEKSNNCALYVGKAKNRLEKIIDIFELLMAHNYSCDFNIVDVPNESKVYPDRITYNKYITYNDCLAKIVSSRIIVDVIQLNSSGFTIKICEAVCYNKKIITNNSNIKQCSFYDYRYIRVYGEDEIDDDFLYDNKSVVYSENPFSFDCFLNMLFNEAEKNGNLI